MRGSCRIYQGEYSSHEHDFAQVLFGLNGCLELDLAGRAARVDGTTGLVVPAGMPHSYGTRCDTQVWVVDAYHGSGLDRMKAFQLPSRWQASIGTAQLLDCIAAAPRALQRRALNPETLQNQVRKSLHEEWSIARMAAWYALSVPQFHRRWKALTGESPQRWLRLIRLEHAAQMLQRGLTLEVVAARTGYGSASALCQALQREQGKGARLLRQAPR
ncbi:helix-turn-helix domain-containing protein [Granulosicoccus sp. 3-233]|uniref:helix-turn-helix domain-containing protein n=1 Tax=Granulosicoccus sp. 3-233 TaxID=3417969 RepID=UPI003D3419D8